MKNKILYIIISLFFTISCSTIDFIPDSYDDIKSNHHGAYIEVKYSKKYVRGEFIAIQDSNIYVHQKIINECVKIHFSEINDFELKIANAPNFLWTIPAFAMTSFFTHGYFMVYTGPFNLITTTWLYFRGKNMFTYSAEDIRIHNLYKFARYPQGIPEGINYQDIK